MMNSDWQKVTDDEILNHTGVRDSSTTARYERILQKRTIDATGELKDKLVGLIETIYRASQGIQEKAEKLFSLQDRISRSQTRQQNVLIGLSVVVAISTAVYTWITWQSVEAMREANEIQRQLLVLQKTAPSTQPAANLTPQGSARDKAAHRP
jgi:hypothetical protein